MNIPVKYQVFEVPVLIFSKDQERLKPLLSGWMRLAPEMPHLNEPDLRRLIILELTGRKRRKIIGRLLQRLGVAHTARIDEKVWRLLPAGKPREDFR